MRNKVNLLIITIDCMRADVLSQEITPFIWKLGTLGTIYSSAYANGCGTPDSFPAIFASRLARPFAHQPGRDFDEQYALKPEDLTLAEALSSAGYETAAFVAGNPYLGRRYHYHRGFDTYEDNQPGSLVDRVTGGRLRGALRQMAHRLPWSPYPSAEKVSRAALEWLSVGRSSNPGHRPFFLWVHYMDAHFPTLPPGHRGLQERQAAWSPIQGDPAKHHDLLVRLYRDSLTYIDLQVQEFLALVPPETTAVITSDHGQLFGEHCSYWHNGVWEQLLRVPLIIIGPSVAQGVVDYVVQLLDLSPHLLGLLEVAVPNNWAGQGLFTPSGPIYAVSNNPGGRTYCEAWIGVTQKVVRTPYQSWEYDRTTEPPDMVLS